VFGVFLFQQAAGEAVQLDDASLRRIP